MMRADGQLQHRCMVDAGMALLRRAQYVEECVRKKPAPE